MAAAIEVESVSKVFKIQQERYRTLKERLIHFGRIPSRQFWALDDVSLRVEAGQTFGLLGHNGSGKSTLLKCVAGILQPSAGAVRTVGRLAALLELGAGFHPDLSGRENVYLNASILGIKRAEVDRIFDDIVGFAELEEFIDAPVKHYSSGMYVRLGFAVAINVDPEILLVDEVLAVGDESFQRKCLDKVKTFQQEGRTIMLVTHSADFVRQLCDHAIALDHGKIVVEGEPNEVIRSFRERLMSGSSSKEIDPEMARTELSPLWGKVRIVDVTIRYPDEQRSNVHPTERLAFEIELEADEPQDDVVVGIAVYTTMGYHIYGTNTELKKVELGTVRGRRRVTFAMDGVPLLDGVYALTVGIHTRNGLVFDHWEQKRMFEVATVGREVGVVALPISIEVD